MSPSYWFFVSYARKDADRYLEKFIDELIEYVWKNVDDAKREEIGFFDTSAIEPGQEWPATLTAALQNTGVMVPIYTPGYFRSDYCGREWQLFEERRAAFAAAKGGSRPPVILPVLWVGEKNLPPALPQVASVLQYKHADFGDRYAEQGMWQLMKLSKHRDLRREMIASFGQRLIAAFRQYPLPPLPGVPSIQTTANAFLPAQPGPAQPGIARPAPAPVAASGGNAGPRYVQFIFVAGKRDELQTLRSKLDCYGPEGEVDWQPYLPDLPEEVAILAMSVATSEKLRYETIPLGPDLIDRLQAAQQANKVVALVVDTWTLLLPRYHDLMREFDDRSFPASVIVVPWNPGDEETKSNRALLEDALNATFLNRLTNKDPSTFLDTVHSADDLRSSLSTALNVARMRILNRAEVKRRLASRPIPMVQNSGADRP